MLQARAKRVDSRRRFARAAQVNHDRVAEFRQIVSALLVRFCAQNAENPPSVAEADRFVAQLQALIAERRLPQPLPPNEPGRPGGMSDAEVAPLVARVTDGFERPLLHDAARQLVKACFYPEFRQCRDSFREVSADGRCRRQELARARRRVSGAHCVDCPHFVALDSAEHRAYLDEQWCGERGAWHDHAGVFLPEDFRALRRWLHAEARRQHGGGASLSP